MTNKRTFLLDAGALVAIESDPRGDVSERCIAAAKGRRFPLLPAVVFAQVWRNSSKQHVLTVIRSRCLTVPFTGKTANAVGNLLTRSRTSDVVDAAVVLAAVGARRRGDHVGPGRLGAPGRHDGLPDRPAGGLTSRPRASVRARLTAAVPRRSHGVTS